jgi:hypothetical protein
VPTPFYHLSIAEQILLGGRLKPATQALLEAQRGAFLFGHTAPDVQTLSGQPREATHFFNLPPEDTLPPWERMLRQYPQLAAGQLPEPPRAFIAGYLCHIQADLDWLMQIFIPVFGPQADWADFEERLTWHNVLRAWMDQTPLRELPDVVWSVLESAQPDGWLPFVDGLYLASWRDYLVQQLRPGGRVETAEIFARRLGLEPSDFEELLSSGSALEDNIFSRLPKSQLEEYRGTLIHNNIALIEEYLGTS